MARRLLITGRPGAGKSTLFTSIVEEIRSMGCMVGGISAPEVRGSDGRRIGFKIVDLASGREAWLARSGRGQGPRIGRYIVDVGGASRVGATAVEKAVREADVIAIDEVGPMELVVEPLRNAILAAARSCKPLLAVMHFKLRWRDPIVYDALTRGARIVEVTIDNRIELAKRARELAGWLLGETGCRSYGRESTTMDTGSLGGSS